MPLLLIYHLYSQISVLDQQEILLLLRTPNFYSPNPLLHSFSKSKKLAQANASPNKSYAQASKTGSNMESILKIKEAFPTLKAKSIDNIQRMIKGDGRPKPCINMTTKGPSRKQVIVLMNKENKKNFMKESSAHVTNMNRVLKNIKLEVMVDFM